MLKKSILLRDEICSPLYRFSKELLSIGITYVGHGVIDTTGLHTGFFSKKEWGEKYIAQRFNKSEPILKSFDQTHEELVYWELIPHEYDPCSVMVIRAKECRAVKGITLHSSYKEFDEYFNLGFESDSLNLDKYYQNYEMLLKNYLRIFRYYHTELRAYNII